jgi:UPF0755 protein
VEQEGEHAMSQLGLDMSPGQQTRRSRLGSIIAVLLALIVVAALLGGLLVLGMRLIKTGGADDYPGPGTGSVVIKIPPGARGSQIAETLAANSVIKDAKTFVNITFGDDRLTHVQPGTYRMRLHMSSSGALDLLLDPSSRLTARVVIPEGATVKKTLQLLESKGGLDAADLAAALADTGALGLPPYAHGKVEGFLFPATYNVDPSFSAADELKAMVTRWKQAAVDDSLVSKAKTAKMTPYQVLIVASLVQAEVQPADFAKVARVIDNRLAKGKALQLDTTVLYALGRSGIKLTPQDLKTDSPYNTYLHSGLPPTPIDNPGDRAIQAALQPAKGNWLYYVTVNLKTGETKFTNSYKEFLQFKKELKANGG